MFQAGQYRVLHLGCWGDQEDRAIATLEGTGKLTGDYKTRYSALWKCLVAAHNLGELYLRERTLQ